MDGCEILHTLLNPTTQPKYARNSPTPTDDLKHKAYYLPADLLAKVDAYHRQSKKTRNQIVAEALAEYLRRCK